MDIDPKYRQYVVENVHLDNPDDSLAKRLVAVYARRWFDFLDTITDNDRGEDGVSFAEKWLQNRKITDADKPHFVRGATVVVAELAEKLIPNFHKEAFVTCLKLYDDYVIE